MKPDEPDLTAGAVVIAAVVRGVLVGALVAATFAPFAVAFGGYARDHLRAHALVGFLRGAVAGPSALIEIGMRPPLPWRSAWLRAGVTLLLGSLVEIAIYYNFYYLEATGSLIEKLRVVAERWADVDSRPIVYVMSACFALPLGALALARTRGAGCRATFIYVSVAVGLGALLIESIERTYTSYTLILVVPIGVSSILAASLGDRAARRLARPRP
jgi:hypothetical protein